MQFNITDVRNTQTCADRMKKDFVGKQVSVLFEKSKHGQNCYIGKLAEVQLSTLNPKEPQYVFMLNPLDQIERLNTHTNRIEVHNEKNTQIQLLLSPKILEIKVLDPINSDQKP